MLNPTAYIDAYGDPALDTSKAGATTHFIITAVIIDQKNMIKCEETVEGIRRKYFQTGEIKSSLVGKKTLRRNKVLSELMKMDIILYSLVVDKTNFSKKVD